VGERVDAAHPEGASRAISSDTARAGACVARFSFRGSALPLPAAGGEARRLAPRAAALPALTPAERAVSEGVESLKKIFR
jgi:hypothetical protein